MDIPEWNYDTWTVKELIDILKAYPEDSKVLMGITMEGINVEIGSVSYDKKRNLTFIQDL